MLRLTAAAAGLAILFAGPAAAEFELADRYTDKDGDLLADIPEDPSDGVIPTR